MMNLFLTAVNWKSYCSTHGSDNLRTVRVYPDVQAEVVQVVMYFVRVLVNVLTGS
jgi:hypothetical protein